MKQVNIHEAKTHLSKIVKEVEAGEQYLIGKAGTPVALLIPYSEKPKARKPGALKDQIFLSDDFDSYDEEIANLFESSDIEPS